MRCDKCGARLIRLYPPDKSGIWTACPVCDKKELAGLEELKKRS